MRDNGKFYKRDSEAECPNLRAGRSGFDFLDRDAHVGKTF